jgi:hypothetical protein
LQLQLLVGGKRDLKPSSSDEPNKRIMSRLKAAQSSGKGTTGEKSQAGKDNAKRAAKRSRKRRRAQDDSRSTSQDKNSTIMPGKQIKITKDKHFLNPNISKMIRKSINDCSHGQEKTVKIGSKNKEKQALEEKKKQLGHLQRDDSQEQPAIDAKQQRDERRLVGCFSCQFEL